MNSDNHIVITGMGSISPLGSNESEVWKSYQCGETFIKPVQFNGEQVPVAKLSEKSESKLRFIRSERKDYQHLDKTVIMALYCAREAVKRAGWGNGEGKNGRGGEWVTGVNIGSSRGATELLEKYHGAYLANPLSHLFPLTSPTTTLGNISSSVAHDIEAEGPAISHSVTCSTAFHAVFNGMAWMRAGMADRFVVGGSEAPLTGFTIAQMKALRVYTSDVDAQYSCRPCLSESTVSREKNLRHDSFVLGEGAAVFALEQLMSDELENRKENILGVIESIGYAQENAKTPTAITEEGNALQKSMTMALRNVTTKTPIDLIILHAPGTIKGDSSELMAIRKVFGEDLPILVSNKWLIGHTFGASAALSLEYALLILANQHYVDFPYPVMFKNKQKQSIKKIMINAAGFGGNAASLIVSKLND